MGYSQTTKTANKWQIGGKQAIKIKNDLWNISISHYIFGAPGRIRTCDLRIADPKRGVIGEFVRKNNNCCKLQQIFGPLGVEGRSC